MKSNRISILFQIIFYELIICAQGHGIIPICLFNFALGDIRMEERNIILGLIISQILAILILITVAFIQSGKLRLVLFKISAILFVIGIAFLCVYNGTETLLFPILSGAPFYYMTFKTYKNLQINK